jgi:hypothetical protein
MRSRLGALVLVGLALLVAPAVSAGDKEDVAAAVAEWTKLFVDDNPDALRRGGFPESMSYWSWLQTTASPSSRPRATPSNSPHSLRVRTRP